MGRIVRWSWMGLSLVGGCVGGLFGGCVCRLFGF